MLRETRLNGLQVVPLGPTRRAGPELEGPGELLRRYFRFCQASAQPKFLRTFLIFASSACSLKECPKVLNRPLYDVTKPLYDVTKGALRRFQIGKPHPHPRSGSAL